MFTSRRKRKKAEYAEIQRMYKRNRQEAFNQIFNKTSFAPDLRKEEVFSYWTSTLTKSSFLDYGTEDLGEDEEPNVDDHITIKEIEAAKLSPSSACGPDGVTVRRLGSLPSRAKCKLYNLWLWLRWVPDFVLDSRTIFIPKGENIKNAAKLRPISIASVLLRQFYKILAARLAQLVTINENQYGFQPFDGICKGIKLFDDVLLDMNSNIRSLSVAVLDLQKAFDSVDHGSIFVELHAAGVPQYIIKYLRSVYEKANTFLTFQGNISERIHPTRGVRQGDPLSPIIFLVVFDKILRALPREYGYPLAGVKITHIAYADDLLLMSQD